MLIRDINQLNQLLVDNLHKIRALPFDVIVHLPRSGTIPASLLATYLVKPFCSVEEYVNGLINTRKAQYKSLNRILLVDDSIRTGFQMQEAIKYIKQRKPDTQIETLSIFSTKTDRTFQPSLFLSEHMETEYMYPWFMWKSKRITKAAVDMDGVLCRDCIKSEDDDGPNYQNFLQNVEPKFLTTHTIGAIITSRLEKYRPQTVEWLRRHNVKYNELIMGPWHTQQERRGNAGEWKAKVYGRSPYLLYIESSIKESEIIASKTNKTVWCIDNQKVYNNKSVDK